MSALDAANQAAELLGKELARLGLDVHAYGGLAIFSGNPPDGEPYVTIQGHMDPEGARMIARALGALRAPDDPGRNSP